jgi:hypothetical protein
MRDACPIARNGRTSAGLPKALDAMLRPLRHWVDRDSGQRLILHQQIPWSNMGRQMFTAAWRRCGSIPRLSYSPIIPQKTGQGLPLRHCFISPDPRFYQTILRKSHKADFGQAQKYLTASNMVTRCSGQFSHLAQPPNNYAPTSG